MSLSERRRSKMLGALVTLAAVMPGTTNAALITFDNLTDWQNAFDPSTQFTTDNFSNPTSNAETVAFDSGVVSSGTNLTNPFPNDDRPPIHRIVGAPGGTSNFFAVDIDADNELSGFEFVTWTFPSAVNGFAMNWDITNSPNTRVTMTLSSGDTFTFGDDFGTRGNPPTTFLGFFSDTAFQSISLSTNLDPQSSARVRTSNLLFGAMPNTQIPEPTTLALMCSALLGVGACQRRRRMRGGDSLRKRG
ncbi:MAG: PEP-CTERM sorting domain-containing protein [Pseudomonadota bacterium]